MPGIRESARESKNRLGEINEIWGVVLVESGIPTELNLFKNHEKAQDFAGIIEKDISHEDDCVDILRANIQ